ncbi:MAG: hypothetical protein ICV87_15230 [Gemmatimonadetes bacterium]|nr:hypothetical protein [Gemmatimonadota bacterium]
MVVLTKDLKLDDKKRATLSGAAYEHYRMTLHDDGTIVLEPRVLVNPNALTAKTLREVEAGEDVRRFNSSAELFADLED